MNNSVAPTSVEIFQASYCQLYQATSMLSSTAYLNQIRNAGQDWLEVRHQRSYIERQESGMVCLTCMTYHVLKVQ